MFTDKKKRKKSRKKKSKARPGGGVEMAGQGPSKTELQKVRLGCVFSLLFFSFVRCGLFAQKARRTVARGASFLEGVDGVFGCL